MSRDYGILLNLAQARAQRDPKMRGMTRAEQVQAAFCGFSVEELQEIQPHAPYQPRLGPRCGCRKGVQRDNCAACEGTGWLIDFAAIRARNKAAT